MSARQIHAVMARVLVAHGDDDPEALFEHHRAAGHTELAAIQAAAAGGKASAVLAFDLAVTFYREALALEQDSAQRARRVADLAKALENAGRPIEAARRTSTPLSARTATTRSTGEGKQPSCSSSEVRLMKVFA
jgi:hypothetical protein